MQQKEYCPPIDPALFTAIICDYDLSNADSQQAARHVLDSIKDSAHEQADTGFDPSGTGGDSVASDFGNAGAPSSHAGSCPGLLETRTDTTDLTSLSNDLKSLDVRSDDSTEVLRYFEPGDGGSRSEADKLSVLQEMFPDMKEHSIAYILQKCHSNIDRAMDELLNHAFFEAGELADGAKSVKISAKGIDAFSEDNAQRRARGKRKNKRSGAAMSGSLPSSPTRAQANSWQSGARDIEFIARCTRLAKNTVTSVFRENDGSTQRSIAAILDAPLPSNHPNVGLSEDDAVLKMHALELSQDFPSIPPSRLTSIVRLTHPSTSNAHELTSLYTSRRGIGGLEIIPRYNAPLSDVKQPGEQDWIAAPSPTRSSATPVALMGTPANALNTAAAHSALSERAFTQAQAAYRRGRSDKLMSGAAAYYSQIGRDHAQAASEARGQAADDLVNAQSSASYVDLHGVNVRDAVRIARQKTLAWWKSGAGKGQMGMDGRVTREEGSARALEIVTGVGRHSTGGRGVVGPAVGRMLVNEGWNVRFEEGVVLVSGKRR